MKPVKIVGSFGSQFETVSTKRTSDDKLKIS
jgi:hypothetical protein